MLQEKQTNKQRKEKTTKRQNLQKFHSLKETLTDKKVTAASSIMVTYHCWCHPVSALMILSPPVSILALHLMFLANLMDLWIPLDNRK